MFNKHNILLIRHQKAAAKSMGRLIALGHEVVVFSLSEIFPVAAPLPQNVFDAIIVTSPIGANILDQILDQHANADELRILPVYCVGAVSAKFLRDAGFTVQYSPDAAGLADKLTGGKYGRSFLYPCGRDRSFDFTSRLISCGLNCVNWEIYENRLITPASQKITGAIAKTDTVFLFSKRTAAHFFSVLNVKIESSLLSNHKFIAISQNVAATIPRKFAQNTYIAKNKDEISMIACLDSIGQ